MKKFRKILGIILIIAGLCCLIKPTIYQITHIDATRMRVFVENWRWEVATFVFIFSGYFLIKWDDR